MKISRFQLKVTCHIKNHIKLNEKSQSTDVNLKMTEMLDLSNKDFKAAIIKILQ